VQFDFEAMLASERYKLLLATVLPRPIAWVTTRDRRGAVNAAPFSFFNVFGNDPATVPPFVATCQFTSYFGAILGATPITHPATFLLFAIANPVATMTVMFFKDKYDRPRPSHICPALYPPLQVPGHASYPSGHSTQAHLLAKCAWTVLPTTEQPRLKVILEALAHRIARNREIAGLHYPTDSCAGKKLAHSIFDILNDEAQMRPAPDQTSSRFKAVIDRATLEWKP